MRAVAEAKAAVPLRGWAAETAAGIPRSIGLARAIPIVVAVTFGGCLGPRQSALAPPPTEAPPPVADEASAPILASAVWTAAPEVALFDGVSHAYSIERLFTRLDVIGQDSLGLRLRCGSCLEPVEGYAAPEDVVLHYVPPEVAAWGELAEFALAVRTAAERGDIEALRPVMSPDFSFSFVGIQSVETAIAVWQSEHFQTLSRVPDLLDRGLTTSDDRVWAGPPEFVSELGYQGLRTGFFRRADGRWEWLYLIRGIADR